MSTKDELLKYLKHSGDTWISGETLASALAISRTAIWKHIKALQEDGYQIESSTNRGYTLKAIPDRLLPAEIREGLKTIRFARKNIDYYRETDSTNVRARMLAHEGAPEGTLVVAETQTQGRGRRGRTWFSPPGCGIYMSIILRPLVQPHEAPQLTLLTAVAMVETLLGFVDLPFTIKWPNDILIHGKKISGILTEMAMEMDRVDYVVVGLGLNVSNIINLIGSGGILALLLFIVGSLVIGFLLGGRDLQVRSVMGLGTAQRNVAAAVLVTAQNFSGTNTLSLVLVAAILLLLILLPTAKRLGVRVGAPVAPAPQPV